MQSNAFQLNAFQQDGLPFGSYVLTAETGTYTLTGADATLTYSGAPAPLTVVTNKPGRRWYVVKGKRYYLTNEELAALLARDLIDVVREDVKVSFKNKKPHKVSKATWETLQQTIDSLNKLPGFDEDEESAAMLLL